MSVTARVLVPVWAMVLLAVLLTTIALSDVDPTVRVAAVLAPVAAAALLGHQPLGSLAVCALAAMAMAPAMDRSVPVWTVALAVALAVVGFLAGRRTSRTRPALLVLAAGPVLAVPLTHVDGSAWPIGLLVLAIAVALPWLAGRVVRQQAELAAATTDRVHLAERTRIAHEMHDTLGHELSLLALRAGALELAAGLDEQHRSTAAELRAGAAAATERLADIVALLRDGEAAPRHPETVEEVVDRTRRAGLAVRLDWTGPRPLRPEIAPAAHRVVQEALTNAAKHAPDATVTVRIAVTAGETEIAVTNAVTAEPRRRPGVGLVALAERVRLAGGNLRTGRRDDTFELVATLPHREAP